MTRLFRCVGVTQKRESSNERRFLRGWGGAEALRPVGTPTIISNERQLNGMSAVRKMISAFWLKVWANMLQYWEGKEITRINPYKIKFSFVRHYVEFLINECVELISFFFWWESWWGSKIGIRAMLQQTSISPRGAIQKRRIL